jgi:hypothetical protein
VVDRKKQIQDTVRDAHVERLEQARPTRSVTSVASNSEAIQMTISPKSLTLVPIERAPSLSH